MRLGGMLTVVLAAAACAASDEGEAGSAEEAVRSVRADVTETSELPIAEVSGLGQRARGRGRGDELLAVGDASAILVTFDLDRRGRPTSVSTHDLSSVVGGGARQWEGVAGDGDGRVFLLSETARSIVVVDRDLARVVHTMTFRGIENPEGLVLLANGHVLVAEEKEPAGVVELAPGSQAAAGYSAALALGRRAFALPQGATSELAIVKRWRWKDRDAASLGDVSELAVDAQGRLVLLGDQKRQVVRVERDLSPDEDRLDVKAVLRLGNDVDKPEGLLFAGGFLLVASDEPRAAKPSLFTVRGTW
jgi:uncharacterized protein YjiK